MDQTDKFRNLPGYVSLLIVLCHPGLDLGNFGVNHFLYARIHRAVFQKKI